MLQEFYLKKVSISKYSEISLCNSCRKFFSWIFQSDSLNNQIEFFSAYLKEAELKWLSHQPTLWSIFFFQISKVKGFFNKFFHFLKLSRSLRILVLIFQKTAGKTWNLILVILISIPKLFYWDFKNEEINIKFRSFTFGFLSFSHFLLKVKIISLKILNSGHQSKIDQIKSRIFKESE